MLTGTLVFWQDVAHALELESSLFTPRKLWSERLLAKQGDACMSADTCGDSYP